MLAVSCPRPFSDGCFLFLPPNGDSACLHGHSVTLAESKLTDWTFFSAIELEMYLRQGKTTAINSKEGSLLFWLGDLKLYQYV